MGLGKGRVVLEEAKGRGGAGAWFVCLILFMRMGMGMIDCQAGLYRSRRVY